MRDALWVTTLAVWLGACAGPIATSVPIDMSTASPGAELSDAIDNGGIRQVYALPRTFLAIKVVERRGSGTFVVDAGKDIRDFPDSRHVYAIQHNTSFWSDDDLVFEVNAQTHYISKITTKASDRSLDIARLAGTAILRATTGLRDATVGTLKRSGSILAEDLFEDIIDPTNPDDVARVNRLIERFCVRIEVRSAGGNALQAGPSAISAPAAKSTPGIVFRVRVPYVINYFEKTCAPGAPPAAFSQQQEATRSGKLEPHNKEPTFGSRQFPEIPGPRLIGSILFMSANQSPTIPMSLERAYFVQVTQDYVFDATGKNTSTVKKPSEALSFMQLPLDIVDAILNVPVASIKQLYTDEQNAATAEDAAYKAQLNVINSRLELLSAQQKLNELQRQNGSPSQDSQTPSDGKDRLSDPGAAPSP